MTYWLLLALALSTYIIHRFLCTWEYCISFIIFRLVSYYSIIYLSVNFSLSFLVRISIYLFILPPSTCHYPFVTVYTLFIIISLSKFQKLTQKQTLLLILYSFFLVIPRWLNFMSRHSGSFCMFKFRRRCNSSCLHHLWRWK